MADLETDKGFNFELLPLVFNYPKDWESIIFQETSCWRINNRIKTVNGILVLCLNIGVDPPDLLKISPKATLECWIDPASLCPHEALELIGVKLQEQYSKWQPKARYKQCLDPTIEDIKKLCLSLRKNAKDERVLFHYNGHGVPTPTSSGELWVFNKNYTQYIPLSVNDLQEWLSIPVIYVFDCSNAGTILNCFAKLEYTNLNTNTQIMPPNETNKNLSQIRSQNFPNSLHSQALVTREPSGGTVTQLLPNLMKPFAPTAALVITDATQGKRILPDKNTVSQLGVKATKSNAILNVFQAQTIFSNSLSSSQTNSNDQGRNVTMGDDKQAVFNISSNIYLGACGVNELLSSSSEMPADLFTSCLTTPIKTALRWHVLLNKTALFSSDLEIVDKIPGQLNDRRTMLGELNWIFTAITDSIAWNSFPKDLFQRLFRQDLLVASLFRNFLLAERIMHYYGNHPVSHPLLPRTSHHTMWLAWDFVIDTSLRHLNMVLKQQSQLTQYQSSLPLFPLSNICPAFFSEQLQSFQSRLLYESPLSIDECAELLPIVLQVLLSQVHRVKALDLLGKFLDLGPAAVNQALSVGIFPYMLKLLQSPAREMRPLLIYVWAKILSVDNSCQADLIKENGHKYFLSVLSDVTMPVDHRTMAAFCISSLLYHYIPGQEACMQENIISICLEQLSDTQSNDSPSINIPKTIEDTTFEARKDSDAKNGPKENNTCPSFKRSHRAHMGRELLKQWLIVCLALDWRKFEPARWRAIRDSAHDKLKPFLGTSTLSPFSTFYDKQHLHRMAIGSFSSTSSSLIRSDLKTPYKPIETPETWYGIEYVNLPSPEVRVATVCALGTLISGSAVHSDHSVAIDHVIARELLTVARDGSHQSRKELVVAIQNLVTSYEIHFTSLASKLMEEECRNSVELTNSHRSYDFHYLTDTSSKNAPLNKVLSNSSLVLNNLVDNPPLISSSNIYYLIWKTLNVLSADPYPDVAQSAKSLISCVKSKVNMLSAKKETCLSKSLEKQSSSTYLTSLLKSEDKKDSISIKSQTPPEVSHLTRPTAIGSPIFPLFGSSVSSQDNSLTGQSHLYSHEFSSTPYSFSRSRKIFDRGPSLITLDTHDDKSDVRSNQGSLYYPTLHSSFISDSCKLFWQHINSISQKENFLQAFNKTARVHKYALNNQAVYEAKRLLQKKPGSTTINSTSTTPYWIPKFEYEACLTKFSCRPSCMKFFSYDPMLAVADSLNNVSLWNTENQQQICTFVNGPPTTKITCMEVINDFDIYPLLCIGSSDGSIKVWKNLFSPKASISPRSITPTNRSFSIYSSANNRGTSPNPSTYADDQNSPQLLTAWVSLPEFNLNGLKTANLRFHWQQNLSLLFVSGDAKIVRIWDLQKQLKLFDIPTRSEYAVTTLNYSPANTPLLAVGFSDGSIKLFDIRMPDSNPVKTYKESNSPILKVAFYEGTNGNTLISGSFNGEIKMWNLSSTTLSSMKTAKFSHSVSSLDIHPYSTLVAGGLTNQTIGLYNPRGNLMCSLKSPAWFTTQKFSAISSVLFHPHKILLATCSDNLISLYTSNNARK